MKFPIAMKAMSLLILLLSILESGAESEESENTWSALATQAKPVGPNFEEQFRSRHFYLVSQGLSTRVPRGSILHLPEKHQELVAEKPQGRQVSWFEFLAANRSWVKRQDVIWRQVLGKVPLSKETLESFATEARLVVATFQGGPVTVLPINSNQSASGNPKP